MTSPLRNHSRIRAALWAAGLACALGAGAAQAQQGGEPLRHIVRPGDTLYDLAQAYLEDPRQWPELARLNGDPRPRALRPGAEIVIPDALLRRKPGVAKVAHVSGGVRYLTRGGASGALETGMRLIDGDRVETDGSGFATLEMADGSVVRVTGDSELRLERLRFSLTRKRADTSLALDKGRVESRVAPQRPTGSRFQVETPLMAAGVRGTEFGVSVASGRATSDVLEGGVQLRVKASGTTANVDAGSGGAVAAGAQRATLAALLPRPDLSSVRALQERPLIDLAFPAVEGAAAYRAFIWRAGETEQVLSNVVAQGPRVRFPGLPDGSYVVRVSGIDRQGIEGRPATWPITLKARPEPPITLAPTDGGSVESASATLQWGDAEGVNAYRLQLSRNAEFTDLIIDEPRMAGTRRDTGELPTGTYYWRIGSVIEAPDGKPDNGPFSDVRKFTLRKPMGKMESSQTNDGMVLRWDGEDGQRYLAQIARDAAFGTIVAEQKSAERQWALKLPSGEYFLRVQATDPDGYVRDFTKPQRFRVLNFVQSGSGALRSGDGQEIQIQ